MKRTISALAIAGLLSLAGTAYVAHAQSVSFLKGQSQGELATVRLAGTRVFNAKAEVIGTIADIVLGADGRATTVVVNVGGFAGFGAKQVAVPYAALKVGPVVEGSRVLLLDATTDQLKAAPAYVATDPNRTDRAKKRAADWLKVAREKAIELGKQAGEAVQDIREKIQQPAPATPGTPAPATPAPKQ